MTFKSRILAASALALCFAATEAAAQITRGETVTGLRRPDLEPLGVTLGSFLLFPSIALQETYEDNIFFNPDDEEADFITSIEPAVLLRSNWNNHALNLRADSRVVRYLDNDDEDFEDYTLAGDGRLDITRDTNLFAGAGHRLRHEDRASPDDIRGTEPTEFSISSFNLGASHRLNRLLFRLNNEFDIIDFDDTPSATGTINQDDRDREVYTISLQGAYEIAPRREVFLRGSWNQRDYDQNRDDNGFNRDSDGFEIAVGTNYDLTGVLLVEAFLGYRQQEYDDARLDEISGPSAGANLIWNVTRLTTVIGGISREIEETTLNGSSGYFSTRANVRVDHELLRNLLLNAGVGYRNDDFEGINREDDFYTLNLGAQYLLTRNFALSAGYTFLMRDTNVVDDTDLNRFFLRLGARL